MEEIPQVPQSYHILTHQISFCGVLQFYRRH